MNILKDIEELVRSEIITIDVADKIQKYYNKKDDNKSSRLFIVFGVLGALLVGLGIILILAHNWDDFPRSIKTVLAFLPLVVVQLICLFTIYKNYESDTWRESSATFLFFTIGASISLVSQIYNIPGNLNSFILTWMVLALPIVYIMRSSMLSLLYIAGITYYACNLNYWTYNGIENYYYWILLASIVPYYYLLIKNKTENNFTNFHHWFISLSIVICLGIVAGIHEDVMFLAYFSLFAIFYAIGNSKYFRDKRVLKNSYLVIGSLGTVILLVSMSFDWYWEELDSIEYLFNSLDFLVSLGLFLLASIILVLHLKNKSIKDYKPIYFVYLIFFLLMISKAPSFLAIVVINILLLFIGVWTIKSGEYKNHLGILNYGLLILTALVISRFFDENISFVIRGSLFLIVGFGCFFINYRMLKKRRNHEV